MLPRQSLHHGAGLSVGMKWIYRIILQHPVTRVKASTVVRIRIKVVCVRGSCSFVVGY